MGISRVQWGEIMPSFDQWYDWAMDVSKNPPSDTSDPLVWKHVAQNAMVRACYSDAKGCEAFKEKLAEKAPKTEMDFEKICWTFQLTGSPVSQEPSRYLTRCITLEALRRNVEKMLQDRGVSVDVEVVGLESDTWKPLADSMDLSDEFVELGLHLADHKANPVFASLAEGDDASPDASHVPGFWQKIQDEKGFRMTLADEAVYRFALVLDKKVEKEYVLLYYDRAAFASFLMPVPPDAGFFPLFRPVTPEEGHSFGRTCPGRPGDCKEDLAEDELVHPNSSVAYDAVWAVSLGRTSLP